MAVRWTALTWSLCLASMGPIRPVHAAQTAAPLAPEEAFDQRFVGFEDQVLVIYAAGRRPSRMWVAYRGKYHVPLRGADFYEAIDRPDLATAYRRRRAAELSLILGGLGAALGGVYLVGSGRHAPGGILLTAGVGGILAGWILEPDPVDEPEAREAADLYNKDLKRRLGLVPATPSAGAANGESVWSPMVTIGGGGLQFTQTF